MKKHKKITILLAAVLFSYGFVALSQWLRNNDPFNLSTVILGTSILIITLLVGNVFSKIFTSLSGKSVGQIKKRLVPTFLLFALFTFIISFSVYFSGIYILHAIQGADTNEMISHLFHREFVGGFIYVLTGILIGLVIFFYIIWQQTINREQLLREENLKYKYRTLKTQVNPHFLFNSLNTLSEIVYTDARKADKYIHRLAGIYRYILEHEETDLVPLNEELEFVKQYFDLQKERDGDSIQLDICVETPSQLKVIPISVQILLENALKHNVVSQEKPLKISIATTGGYIVVSNNIQRKNILSNSPGTGLLNLQQRIMLITGRDMVLTQENGLFIVKLPVMGTCG